MLLILVGLCVGLLSAFFGVGGGVIIVPALYMIFETITPETVIGCSLSIICLNSLINLFNFYRSGKRIALKYLLPMMLTMIPGVLLGGYLVTLFSPQVVKLIFATTALLIALRIFLQRSTESSENLPEIPLYKSSLSGFTGGMLSGLTGLGGGAILVPLFITYLRIPLHLVSFMSNCVMPVGTLFGAITYALMSPPVSSVVPGYQVGQINFAIIFGILCGSVISSRLGVKLVGKVDQKKNKLLFALLLTFISFRIFYKELSSLL